MDENVFSRAVLLSEKKIGSAAGFPGKRYLYGKLKNTPEEYFAGMYGLRGVGKTVMMLQLASEAEKSLYISADAVYLRDEPLYRIIEHARKKGYKSLFLDEVNSRPQWQSDLKTAYDEGGIRIIFSGSSAMEVRKGADLSRRALLFNLKPLSFREYLCLKKGVGRGIEAFPLESLFDEKTRRDMIVKHSDLASHLREFYEIGGIFYPGETSEREYIYSAVSNVLDKIVHNDLVYLRELDIKIENDVFAILKRIALFTSYEVNYSKIAENLSISKPTVIKIIDDLERVGIVKKTPSCRALERKEPKIFLAFPFRSFFADRLNVRADTGTLREEFFINHVDGTCYLKGSRGERTPDFLYREKRLEVGGPGKKLGQAPDFILREGVNLGERDIPLFLCGFNY